MFLLVQAIFKKLDIARKLDIKCSKLLFHFKISSAVFQSLIVFES